jgi:ubiquinone/menaquinone biosynthesis C-methylase UbiE
MSVQKAEEITEAVRSRYGEIALTVLDNKAISCCSSSNAACCDPTAERVDRISEGLYALEELEGIPLKSQLASLGCGNPTALAELKPGEIVLDLGSGGGIDVLISARRVGHAGFAYGVDMTEAMLKLARLNAAEAGVKNVEFLKGDIASIPLPDESVDVIISNCVINLAAEKGPVLREAYRVLKPGGRFAVSDIVIHGGLPEDLVNLTQVRRDLESWAGCIAGALSDGEYREGLAEAGFSDIELEVTRRYTLEDLGSPLPEWISQLGKTAGEDLVSRFASTFVRAKKPA